MEMRQYLDPRLQNAKEEHRFEPIAGAGDEAEPMSEANSGDLQNVLEG